MVFVLAGGDLGAWRAEKENPHAPPPILLFKLLGEAHGHPHSPGPVCDLSAFPSSEVGLPHVFSKQLSDLSSVGPWNNQI